MLSESGRRLKVGVDEGSFADELEKEIGLLRQQAADDCENELLHRSGSAPPTVEGSLSAVGGLLGSCGYSEFERSRNGHVIMSEEQLRSDPDYLSYYYSNAKLNPRLPPPGLSKEDWRLTQRLRGASPVTGGIGDRRKVNRADNVSGGSFFSMPREFISKKDEREVEFENVQGTADWGKDGLIGLPGMGLGTKQKSLAEIIQDDLSRSIPSSRHPSRPPSCNVFDENVEMLDSAEAELAILRLDASKIKIPSSLQHIGAPSSYSYAAALGASLSRSATPDPQHVARTPSPCPTPIGSGRQSVPVPEKRTVNGQSSLNGMSSTANDSRDLVTVFSGMNLSSNGSIDDENHLPSHVKQDVGDHHKYFFTMQSSVGHVSHHANRKKSEFAHLPGQPVPQSVGSTMGGRELRSNPVGTKSTGTSGISFSKPSNISALNGAGILPQYSHFDGTNLPFTNYGLSGYSLHQVLPYTVAGQFGNSNLPPLFENSAAAAAMGTPGMDARGLAGGLLSGYNLTTASDSHNLNRMGNQITRNTLQASFLDPMYVQYLRTAEYAAQLAAINDHSADRSYPNNSYMDLLQKAYLGSLSSSQKSPYGDPMVSKSSGSNPGFYGNNAIGVGVVHPGDTLMNPVIPNSPVEPGSPMSHNEFNMRFPGSVRNLRRGAVGPWHMDGSFGSSLLEEFKSNKTKSFELSEIVGHVVEFSVDQYGSRFIQQKLEIATIEEQNMVFEEIIPHTLSLMTDVFGNYVIQKFFEHGMPAQRRELAGKLDGNVLSLSLQMYGCRVIQKAIEVVDLDQKIKMVQELDGHVMHCVRDQNGNHVIQKCIECVPKDAIHFIVESFFDHVVTLSTHPYGCRVIQRVLEHCKDPQTQSKVMDEIMGSVSMLAQDQYGNYVIQHVLEHGKPHERSAIIEELAGKIVQMSQQKFASNVVEKCLIFGGPGERELMVNEMLGATDENEPLQTMTKDQFANYVVQKVLETCNDEQRELIMARIKVHLNALKKYTYGKHIVARVEKLVAAGERRIAAAAAAAAAAQCPHQG